MNTASWAVSAAGVTVVIACGALLWVAEKHGGRIPAMLHPWAYRLLIFFMYVGGSAVAQTALGAYPEALERLVVSPFGPLWGHVALIGIGLILLVTGLAGLAFAPGLLEAVLAACLPIALLNAGGALAQFALWLPAAQWATQFAQWI